MAKQLNVNLAFTADTGKARAQLQELQGQLNNILKMPSVKLSLTDDIKEAIAATAELQVQLQKATNTNTGNLDFSKFNQALKSSGHSLNEYGQQLQKLGPTGQQAFLTLTKSIATAEIPIKRTNILMKEFATTLANTARWQLSSSILHGFMGAVQGAYGYAQDLNESLSNIRIVTGQNTEQMARFAEQANAAAKALSATTLDYTNASLIYYQQGLTDQQVKERTDVTIKMANVTRTSAETVSEQMTAVWNNFDNGSKSLEYYADVMTALGAATASSADEIAGGLEKFAAIGDTIGLSYEYAAAALATITSNTRQSEEVVGTALKTIFARIQGLNLGETLDDGTTLNKYSEALAKVGIGIFDQTGELKKMDSILDEMGAKWNTLNSAQQTALAQTVAGVRQYTQLVALMENWDSGDADSMQTNLNTAFTSEGTLQKQADIYAETWEAAQNRVTAAAESIYKALLNDEFFIDILNKFEKILTFVDHLIDNLGGLQGVLLALGSIVTKVFSAQLSQGLTNMAYNIKMMTKAGRESVEKERKEFINNAVNTIPQSTEYTTKTELAQQDSLRSELTLQSEYIENVEKMSTIEAEANKHLIERTRILKEQTVELTKQKERIDERVSNGVIDLRTDISAFNMENRQTGSLLDYNQDIQPEIKNIKSAATVQAELKNLNSTIELLSSGSEKGKKALDTIKKAMASLDGTADKDIARLVKETNQLGDSPDPEQLKQKLEALNLELEETIKISQQNIKDVVSPEAGKKVDALTQDLREQAQAARDVRDATEEALVAQQNASDSITHAKGTQKGWSDIMVESANVAFSAATAVSMLASAYDQLTDPDVSGMQKLLTVITTIGMVLPTVISSVGTLKSLFSAETVVKIANAAATWGQVAAEKKLNETKGEGSVVTKKNIKDTWRDTAWKSTNKNQQDKYIEQVLKKQGYVRDTKTGGWGKTTVKKGSAKFDPSTVISNEEAISKATPEAQKLAGKSSLKALGGAMATIAVAAVAIAGAIAIYKAVDEWWNKNAIDAERAAQAADTAAASYDSLKASYDNFSTGLNNYETEVEGLKSLERGTLEYKEALLSANEAAYELINKYDDLKYTVNADGLVTIDEDSLKEAQEKQLKSLETLQIKQQQLTAEAKAAAAKADTTEFLRKDIKTKEKFASEDTGRSAGTGTAIGLGAGAAVGAGVALSGALMGTKFGAALGSFAGPIGTAIGAVAGAAIGVAVGAAVGAAIQNSETERETAAMDKLAAAYVIEGESVFADGRLEQILGDENKDLAAALRANEQETRKLVRETATANSLAAEANRKAVQDQYGHLFEDIENNAEKGAAEMAAGQKLEEVAKQFKEALKDQGGGLTDKEVQQAYAKMRAEVYNENIKWKKDKTGNKGLYSIDGKEESLDDSYIRDELAREFAKQILSGNGIAKTYGLSESEIKKLAEEAGLTDFATNYIEEAKKEVANLKDTVFGEGVIELLNANKDVGALSANFATLMNQEVAGSQYRQYREGRKRFIIDQLGGEEAAKQFAEQYFHTDDIDVVIDSIFNSFSAKLSDVKSRASKQLTSTTEDIFNSLINNTANEIEINELQDVADQIEQAFIMGGKESAQQIADLYLILGDEADEFNDALKGIDWNTVDVYTFRSELINAGINLDNVDNSLLDVIIELGKFDTAIGKVADTIYTELSDISKLSYGDTITEDEWKTVPEYMRQFYTAAAGGGYRLTKDTDYNRFFGASAAIGAYNNDSFALTKEQFDSLQAVVNGQADERSFSQINTSGFTTGYSAEQAMLDFLLKGPGKDSISENNDYLKAIQQELLNGTLGDYDKNELASIFSEVWTKSGFTYEEMSKIIRIEEERQADAITNSLLNKYQLAYKDIEGYATIAEGIAQARFDRGIGEVVSFYENTLDTETPIDVSAWSKDKFTVLQTAIADVLNVETDQITADFINTLASSGQLAQLTSTSGGWNDIIATLRQNLYNSAIDDMATIVGNAYQTVDKKFYTDFQAIAGTADITAAQTIIDTYAPQLLQALGGVSTEGIKSIITFFESLGFDLGYDESTGKFTILGLSSIAATFGVDLGYVPHINTKELIEFDPDQLKKLDEEAERYHEINNELEVLADNLDAISKEKDRAYGANRVKLIDQETAALKQQLSAQERYLDKIENYLADDRAKIDKYGFMFNEDADIINYDEVMDQQIQAYNAAYQAYIAAKNAAIDAFNVAVQSGTSKEDAEKIYDATIKAADATWESAQERYETFEKELQQYEKSVDLLRQQQQVLQDIKYQIQDLNYEKIQYELEIKMEVNDAEMRMLDYYLNKLSDDFYSMAEAAQLMVDKAPLMTQALGNYESFYNELESAHAAGDISQEDYVDGLKQSYDGILNNLEALQDLDKEMQHYYEDTLSAGAEELAVYTSHMEHLTSVLDHYQNIVTMMNGEMDFDNIGTILEGKASTLNNEMKVAESNYAMLKAEQAAMQAAYDAADAEGKKYLKSSLDAINAQVDEAHEAMLSKTKEWAEAQRAIMENSMKKAAHEMEMVFTNNMGFDALNNSMDRLSSYSDEYLTKTNQIYETQKLMNTAQQAIDKTTNQAAKVRLENYNKEIKQLQEKNKLSNLELDIAKAKYDVLLAEIALEEAQNAKATVRLQRDSEGNYGYVYTADKENIAKAEQDLADAQNALYNIGLEGANDYGSKLLDLQQQLADELIALEEARAAGQYKTDEEYYAAKERLISEYNNLFEAYSAQYTTALEVDTAIQQEAWVNAYDEMILKTEDWQIHVDEYTTLCEDSYSHWREVVQTESDIVNTLLNEDVVGAVKNVTDESNNLKDKIVKEVIPAIENEYTQVRRAVLAYEGLRAGLQLTIQQYEKLAEAIQEAMHKQALFEGQTNLPEDPDIPGEEEEEFSPEEPNNKIGHSEMMDLVEDIMVHGSYKNDPERTQKILDAGYTAADRAAAQTIINDIARDKDAAAAWRTGKNWDKVLDEYVKAHGYATGGYTGAWGPEGKLAWLHEKEIVLNARDTENFLAATGILRDISKMIDLNSIQNQMAQLSAVGMTNAAHQILEQAVSIEAHFPNVTDRNEIEEAFNNLINTASQYANRKF